MAPTSSYLNERQYVTRKPLFCAEPHASILKRTTDLEAKYWACAIPKSLPPSPDRQGAGWDPNREYQELMDYTYPLSPGQLKKDSLLQTDMTLQDSGIEMDHFFSSSSLYSRERGTPQPTSPTYPAGWSLDSLDGSMDKDEKNHCRDGGHHHRQPASTSSTCAAFFCSSRLITPYRCGCSIVDPEFQPLPDQLEELQQLSRQVREVTASWGSLDQGPTSILSSITLPKKHEQVSQDHGGREKTAASGDSEAMRSGPPAWMDSIGGGVSQSCLREVEALVEQLCGLGLQGRQTRSQKDLEQCYSLMQHVQVFGSHLEHLIQWLYTVSEKMELLALPTKDIDSVKMLLAEYQSFQRDVSSHQPLTSSVLQSGQLLLSCIGATSPVLADTLLLINRQSWMLETHMEHLFSSILSAMDSLTTVSQTNEDHQSEPEEANHHS
ncbi:centrosomal protein of 68 kDa [Aulostomus maculatus]